jgi:MFS family permease
MKFRIPSKIIPAPMRHAVFRWLWVSMSMSYAGDRLQQLAQTWLVATITGSALAVGGLGAVGSIPLLLLPLSGVIADRVNRRHIIITGQLIGATSTGIITLLVIANRIDVWHIYVWAFINGIVSLMARPSYKVVLTESVPPDEVRSAVAINSMTETAALVSANAGGSVLLKLFGLPFAFVLNTLTYLMAALSLLRLKELGNLPDEEREPMTLRSLLSDLKDGVLYLAKRPTLFHPMLLTFATVVSAAPSVGLLAAIVEGQGGSIIDLGVLSAAFSVGAFIGAIYAGARNTGENTVRRYALFALIVAFSLALFGSLPIGILSFAPLALMGFALFSQAVWNTSRVRQLADSAYQARLQAITSMTFTFGFPVGLLIGGITVDKFGLVALLGNASVLGILAIIIIIASYFRSKQTLTI